MTFEEKIGGKFENYIKLKEIEQNSDGTIFAVAYLDDGLFKVRTFGEVTRSTEEIEREELNINEALGINDFTMPINNFPDPFITCCFVTDDIIFVNLFHNKDLCHHHFFYDRVNRKIRDHVKVEMP